MTTIQSQRENVDSLRVSLLQLLDGMNYCLDWKADDPDWSPREIVYHLLDTPSGGTAALIRKIISGEISEYEIWSDRSNVTEERSTLDYGRTRKRHCSVLSRRSTTALGEAAGDDDLQGRRVLMHQRTRGEDVERTLEEALAGFDRHWRAHMEQLGEVREALGF